MRASWLVVLVASACAVEARAPQPDDHVRTAGADARKLPGCGREPGALSLRSEKVPVRVHYQNAQQRRMAVRVLAALERAWQIEVGELGFRPPPSDEGRCGGDDAFDVFIEKGVNTCYVEAWDDVRETSWDDQLTFMVVDPWGDYGGVHLEATLAHELHHACQAADDWFESEFIMEATATLMEEVVTDGDDGYLGLLRDYQARPDHFFDRKDDYETWFMYGGALYLMYLRDAWFDGDVAFLADVWRGLRGEGPDFEDALDEVLRARAGLDLAGSVVGFARWRWYTGDRDDGRHFEEGAAFPASAKVKVSATVRPRPARVAVEPAPMLWGSAYVDVVRRAGDPWTVRVSVASGSTKARWVLQVVPGGAGADGDVLDLSAGPATVDLGPSGRRTLVLTALPAGTRDDVDDRTARRYPVSLVLE